MNDEPEPSGDEVPMDEASRAAAQRKIAGLQKKVRSLTESDVSVVNIEIRVGGPSVLAPVSTSRVLSADSDRPGSPHPCDEGDADISDPVDDDPLKHMD
jgi:hypothetical protein